MNLQSLYLEPCLLISTHNKAKIRKRGIFFQQFTHLRILGTAFCHAHKSRQCSLHGTRTCCIYIRLCCYTFCCHLETPCMNLLLAWTCIRTFCRKNLDRTRKHRRSAFHVQCNVLSFLCQTFSIHRCIPWNILRTRLLSAKCR